MIKFVNPIFLQIINDHTTRGKCYGFVTFVNPRAANDAINDMNGRVCDFSISSLL
jgi:RNA recognition motif-containing protein